MAQPKPFEPVLLVYGLLWSDAQARAQALAELQLAHGELLAFMPALPFSFSDYYRDEMGDRVFREMVAFRKLIEPSSLADIKLCAVKLEAELASASAFARPVNLDPGIMDRFKFILASMKEGPMRVPLHSGVYAEVTLTWVSGAFTPHRLTYADYRSAEALAFLANMRGEYLKLRRKGQGDLAKG